MSINPLNSSPLVRINLALEDQEGDLQERVKTVIAVFTEDPNLRKNTEISGRVLTLTEKIRDQNEVQKLRRQLVLEAFCKEENNIVTFCFPPSFHAGERLAVMRSIPESKGRFDADRGTFLFRRKAVKIDQQTSQAFIQQHNVYEYAPQDAFRCPYEGEPSRFTLLSGTFEHWEGTAMRERDKEHMLNRYPDRLIFDKQSGKLTCSQKALNRLQADLWNLIDEKVLCLEIPRQDGPPIAIAGNLLHQLSERKPHVEDLVDLYTIKFSDGSAVFPKAILPLFGEYFEALLNFNGSETREKEIDLSASVSWKIFSGILMRKQLGVCPEGFLEVEGGVCSYLQFKEDLPEGTFGAQMWEKYFGYHIDDVPLVPNELLEKLSEPCPIFSGSQLVCDTHRLLLIPRELSLKKIGGLLKQQIKRIEGRTVRHEITAEIFNECKNEKVQESYWVLVTKDILESKGFITQDRAKEENYEDPSILEAAAQKLIVYVEGNKPLDENRDLSTYIFLRERVNDKNVVLNISRNGESTGFSIRYPSSDQRYISSRGVVIEFNHPDNQSNYGHLAVLR